MSEFSGRPQYEDRQSEEDEAVVDSGTNLVYRRLAASAGEPTAVDLPPRSFPGKARLQSNVRSSALLKSDVAHESICRKTLSVPKRLLSFRIVVGAAAVRDDLAQIDM